jgi:hypothetical protein
MRIGLSRFIVPAVLAVPAVPPSAAAQTTAAAGLPLGPLPPALPETISRDDQGRATVRAVRLSAPMGIDGRLDEVIYQEVRPASGFIQMDPTAANPPLNGPRSGSSTTMRTCT